MIRLLYSKINSITIAALAIAGSSALSRFLGIFRDRILAGEFGASQTLDAYYAAFRIPDLIFNLLVLGALSAGFIPVFTRLINKPQNKIKKILSKKTDDAWELASSVINIIAISLIVLCSLGIIFAPFIMKFIAPGFDRQQQEITVNLTRIMFFSPMFLGISSILGGILQSFKRFFVYSLSPILYNLGIILGAIYLVPIWGIYGLAIGVIMGAFMHMAVQLPAVFKLGFKYTPKLDLKNKHIRKIGTMMIPRTLSLAISQLNLVVITIIASTLAEGSLAVFNFANNLQSFPIGIFGISFAVAAFPTLSAVATNKNKLVRNFSSVFRQILFFIMPATVLLLTLRAQIIRVILGTGQFDWEDTILTIQTLGFFSISLFAQATLPLLVRMFYARHNSRTPFFAGLVAVILNILFSWHFSRLFGVAGLALAFSLSNIANFLFLWILLKFELGDMDEIRVLISVGKFSLASLATGMVVQGVKLLVWHFVDMSKLWGVLTQGLIAGLAGIITYVIFGYLLGSEELFSFWRSLKKRLSFRKVEIGDQGEVRGI